MDIIFIVNESRLKVQITINFNLPIVGFMIYLSKRPLFYSMVLCYRKVLRAVNLGVLIED
jgi:hypothetical protein